MSYKVGDILLIKFPFTDLKRHKKRPVLVIKDENDFNDIVCFQITSNALGTNLLKIEDDDFIDRKLPFLQRNILKKYFYRLNKILIKLHKLFK